VRTEGRLTGDASRTTSQSYAAVPAPAMEQERGPLFSGSEANELRGKWDAIQVGFVDEPRRAVEQADSLVAGTMKRLAEIFADERNKLENQWAKAKTFRLRTSGWRCADIGLFSAGCCLSSARGPS
jgi:hypothetical protein